MRITELTRLGSINAARGHAAQRFDKASRVAANGTKVAQPSDDPTAYATKVRTDHALAMLAKRSEVARNTSNELAFADTALAAGVDVLARVRSISVEGANDTLSAGDRLFLAQNVRALREELIGIANTKYGDKHIFGGTLTDTAPFTTNGGFLGNDGVVHVPLAEGSTVAANVSGARAFTAAGGHDVFAEIDKLATALANNDPAAVRATYAALDASHAQIIQAEMSAGTMAERFQSSVDVMETTKVALAQARQDVDGDPAEQLTALEIARTTYEKSIAVTRELLSAPTLAGGTSG